MRVRWLPRYQSRRRGARETTGDPCSSFDLGPSTLADDAKVQGRKTKDRLDRHRVRRRGRAVGFFVDEILQLFTRLEVRDLLRRHVDLVSGLRVAALPRFALAKTEAAKPAELDLFPTMQRVDDALEHRFDDDFGVLLREIGNP